MILGSLFRRAEDAVGSILDQALARVLVAVPLLVAAGFATAAASGYLNARYGSETGNLIMAAGFGVLSLLVAAYVATWPAVQAAQAESDRADAEKDTADGEASASSASSASNEAMSQSERELFNSVVASAAPIALPGLIRMLLRNIPLLIAIVLAAYVFTHQNDTAGSSEATAG